MRSLKDEQEKDKTTELAKKDNKPVNLREDIQHYNSNKQGYQKKDQDKHNRTIQRRDIRKIQTSAHTIEYTKEHQNTEREGTRRSIHTTTRS